MSWPCSSCNCSPCRCTTVTETSDTECTDPGLTNEATYAVVLTEEFCERRLIPFRGLDIEDNQVTDTEEPLQAGMLIQKPSGQVQWSNDPIIETPTSVISVANDIEAADLGNYIPFIDGKTTDFRLRKLVGDADTESGQWKMVWIASVQQWTTVPDLSPEFPDLCTQLQEGFIVDPENTEGYLVQVESTSHLVVGVSVVIAGIEFVVTEIVDNEFVRIVQYVAPAEATVISGLETVCNIGFRPCPQTTEEFADTIAACKDGAVVALETPADISGMKVPGILWRDQLGQWSFLAAPVDGVTGIVDGNMFLGTPVTPADDVANLPSFRAVPFFQPVSPNTTIYSQITSGMPASATQNVVLSSTVGYIPGATIVWVSVFLTAQVTAAAYNVTIEVEDLVRAYEIVGPNARVGTMYNGPFPVPIPVSGQIKIDVIVSVTLASTTIAFTAEVNIDGYTAP